MAHLRALVWALAAMCLLPSIQAQEPAQSDQAPYVTAATVKAWLEEGRAVTFLDVREADEYVAGHLPGARNIRHDEVATLAPKLPQDQPIVLYCIHSAHRAPVAANTLRGLGFSNTYVLEGGIVAWQADGLMILASDAQQTPEILPVTERCEQHAKPSS